MARSLAFWLKNPSQDGDNNTKVELHFNYWSLNNGATNFLDIGILFKDVGNFDSINLYLPFNKDHIEYKPDLGKRVCENIVLVSAIFNSPAKIDDHLENKGIYDFSFSTENGANPLRFFTQILPAANDSLGGVEIENSDHGSEKGCLIKFPRDPLFLDLKKDSENYFRFRIILKSNAHRGISQIYKAKDSFVTNHFEKTEMVDFRVNEARNLPEKIKANLNESSHLSRVHFFLIREANSEYKMSHSEYSRCRILEDNLWNRYLEDDFFSRKNQGQMLIYHWKTKSNEQRVDHFSAFAKFTRRNVTNLNIIGILLLLVGLSFFSGLLTNFAWSSMSEEVESCDASLGTPHVQTDDASNGGTSSQSSEKGQPHRAEGDNAEAQNENSNLTSPNTEVRNND